MTVIPVTQAEEKLYENGIKRIFSCTGLSVLYVVISGVCTLLHPSNEKSERTSETSKGSVNHSFRPEGSTDGIVNDYGAIVKPEDHDNNYTGTADDGELAADSFRPNGNGTELAAGRHDYDVHANELKEVEMQANNDSKGRGRKSEVGTASCASVEQEAEHGKIIKPKDDVKAVKLRRILCSRMLLSHLAWTSATALRYYYFIGSVNRFLEINVESENQVSYFLDVMSYTMLGGFLSSFIAGTALQIQHRWFTGPMRLVIPMTVTSFLSILLSSLAFVSTTAVYYADFVVVTSIRSFVNCVSFDFIRSAFPERYMSIIYGIVLSVTGTFNLTQYALFAWTEVYSDAMTHVNICLLCLSIISLLHPIQIYCFERRILKNENDK
ncbi:uncharacterized protein LOC132555074 [Ylistrum balloti]|uniref:uncharacterized protein LOC132555074 n=1 Tax=Ylistrum balloti TaxID=509963 RepID=UPI002905A950|nr:uncharacterized protein LOC132555074 [Ylistrum balloti]